jgi:hypothetical protein
MVKPHEDGWLLKEVRWLGHPASISLGTVSSAVTKWVLACVSLSSCSGTLRHCRGDPEVALGSVSI